MPIVFSFRRTYTSVLLRTAAMVGRIIWADGGLMTTFAGKDTAPSHRWLRLLLVLVAALEFLDALSGVSNIFTDYHHDTTLLRFAQALISVNLALAPLLAGAALIFAALGKIRYAILALAAITLATWVLDSLPSIALRGVTLGLDFGTLVELFLYVVAPVVAAAAALLAVKDKWIALTTLLACLPALAKWIGFVAFFIAIMIYGF
jgi:succinate dehydrogenase hydrophobic anchor subunit